MSHRRARTHASEGEPQAEPHRPGDDPALPGTPPAGWPRTLTNLAIAGVIALHVAVPLSYYLGHHPYDERFAWRMFSVLRTEPCHVEAVEDLAPSGATRVPSEERVDLARHIHEAWISSLDHRRPSVVGAFFDWACRLPPPRHARIRAIELRRFCKTPDGKPMPMQVEQHSCPASEAAR